MKTFTASRTSFCFMSVRSGRKQKGSMSEGVFRDQIIRYGDYRKKIYNGITVSFESFLESNMAYVRVQSGVFMGNGWEDCNLFGMELSDVLSEMDRFVRCSMGGVRLKRAELDQSGFRECTCTGSIWEQAVLKGCSFTDCNFRGAYFEKAVMKKTRFLNCAFDGVCMTGVSMSQVLFQNCVFTGTGPALPGGCRLKGCVYKEQ